MPFEIRFLVRDRGLFPPGRFRQKTTSLPDMTQTSQSRDGCRVIDMEYRVAGAPTVEFVLPNHGGSRFAVAFIRFDAGQGRRRIAGKTVSGGGGGSCVPGGCSGRARLPDDKTSVRDCVVTLPSS